MLRTTSSVNQLRVDGAVADLFGESARDSRGTGNPPRMIIWNQWLYRQNFPLLTVFLRLMSKYKETCCVKTSRNSQNILNKRNWPNSAPMLVSRRTLRKDTSSSHVMMMHSTIWKDHVESIPYLKVRNQPRERVDPWKHEDRHSPGCEGLLSSRTLRCGDHDRIFFSWQNCFLGSHRERNQQIRHRNVWKNPVACVENRGTGKPVAEAESRPTPTLTLSLVCILYRERNWINVEPAKFSQGCFEVSEFHDQTVATWWYSSSRRWWSCKIWRLGRIVSVKVCGYFVLVSWSWDQVLGKSRRTEEKRFSTAFEQCFQTFLVFPSNLATFRRYSRSSCIARQCTVPKWLRRSHLPQWERSRLALRHPEWIEKVSKGTGSPCFSQPWTRRTPINIRKKFNTIWKNPDSRCTKILGVFTKIRYIGAIWNSLREKDCSSIKHDPTQSLFSTLYMRLVLRKWYTWRLERFLLQSIQISKNTASRTHAKFASWTSGSVSFRSKNILRPSKRMKREVRGNSSR